ncbi:MAG: Mechanosensitive ion channel family protein [Thermodesulfobacteriota bacterium]|nr:Mechanosensitive ion channel family protein [Thermodesulfobacteriota bacterium]
MHRTIPNALFCLLAITVCFILPTPSARSQGPAAGSSVEELEEVLGVIENPKKREAFIKDLKALVAAKKALDEKKRGDADQGDQQLFIVRWVFERVEALSRGVSTAAKTVGDAVAQAPEGIRRIQAFLGQSENRSGLLTLFLHVGIAAMIALMSALLLGRPVRSTVERMKTLPSKIGWGCVQIILRATPYLILCIAFIILVESWPSFSPGSKVVLLFFVLLFFYRTAMGVFQVLFSPEEPDLRIVSVSDENAHYLWIWTRRFAMYAFFYFMATRPFLLTHTVQPFFSILQAVLLIPFPVMLTVFVFQIAREVRARRKMVGEDGETGETPENQRTRLLAAFIRYWPILALGYVWAIFVSLMLQYEKGFEYLFRATLGTAVTLLLMLGSFRGLDLMFRRFFRISERIRDRFPSMEEKANRYVRMVRKGLTVVVVGIGLGAIGGAWGVPVSDFVASDAGGMIILRAVAIILTVAVVVCVIEMCNTLSNYLLRERRGRRKKEITQKQKTLIPVIRTAVNIGAAFVGGIIILDRLGVNTTPILAGAGIVGLAVGFGSQTLVKDLINGLFILFEESIRVGDYATVGNQEGMVESVGLRTVKLRDLNGIVHVIPNSTIDSLSNYSKVFSRMVMDIGIAYREDVDEVMKILKELGEELQRDPEHGPSILEPLEILGLDRFEDSAVIIRARFKTKPLKQWGVKREFYRRMKRVFDERGIEIPFPHQTLYMGEPKEGKAPPLRITINEKREYHGPAPETPIP